MELGVKRVDGLYPGGMGGKQAKAAHQLIRRGPVAALIPIGSGANGGTQVFGAPGQASEALAAFPVFPK